MTDALTGRQTDIGFLIVLLSAFALIALVAILMAAGGSAQHLGGAVRIPDGVAFTEIRDGETMLVTCERRGSGFRCTRHRTETGR